MKTTTIMHGDTPWNLEKVLTPQRYVWHTSYRDLKRSHRPPDSDFGLREKIRREGLICRENWAVFANNGLIKPEFIFPFCIDHFSFCDTVQVVMNTMTRYDFWRIDTEVYKGEWFVDPLMTCDIEKRYQRMNKHWFVCTLGNIPPSALKLFTFENTAIEEIGKYKVNYTHGAANVSIKQWTDNLVEHVWESPQENTLEYTKPLFQAA
jgi:hypothetical protein